MSAAPQDSTPTATAAVKFSRLPNRGILLGLSGAQLTASGVAIVLIVGSLYAAGAVGFAACAPLWISGIAAATVPVGGRKSIDWAPIVLGWQWRRLRGHTTYRHPTTPSSGLVCLPGQAGDLRAITDDNTGAVLVHDPQAMTLTATVEIAHDGFPLQDTLDQQRRTTGWGRVLSACCRTGRIARLQILQRSIPDTGTGLAAWWQTNATNADTPLARTYRNLIDRAAPTAERHLTTLSVAFDLRAAARRIRAAGGGRDASIAVLRKDLDTLTQALVAADLEPSPPFTSDALAAAIRTAYTPTRRPHDEDPSEHDHGELTLGGPAVLEEHWDHLRTDGTFHAVLWISQWPQTRVHPGFLTPLLLHAGARRTFTLLYEPVRVDRAIRDLRRKKTDHLADAAHRARIGQIEDARNTAELRDVRQQEAELVAGHGLLRYTGLLTVTADTRDDLEAAIADTEQAALQAGCETERLYGQQARAFTAAALPLCHGW